MQVPVSTQSHTNRWPGWRSVAGWMLTGLILVASLSACASQLEPGNSTAVPETTIPPAGSGQAAAPADEAAPAAARVVTAGFNVRGWV